MRNSGFVGFREALGHLRGHVDHLSHRQESRFQQLAQRAPHNQFHRDVMTRAIAPQFVNRDDVRIIQRGR